MRRKLIIKICLPHVRAEEFKEMPWAKTEEELVNRLDDSRSAVETAAKLNEEMREKSMQRIAKRQAKYEEDMMVTNPQERERLILSQVLKATASALDAQPSILPRAKPHNL